MQKGLRAGIRACNVFKIRGAKTSKFELDRDLMSMFQNVVNEFGIDMTADKKPKGNRFTTVIAALAPIMMICSEYIEKNHAELLTIGGKTHLKGEDDLEAAYRWHGSAVCWPVFAADGKVEPETLKMFIKAYEAWSQSYITIRRRTGDLTATTKQKILWNRAIERSWYGRQIETYNPGSVTAWLIKDGELLSGPPVPVSDQNRIDVTTALGYDIWAQLQRPKDGVTAEWAEANLKKHLEGLAL
jgi:hypothetical protein